MEVYNKMGKTPDFPILKCGGYLIEHLENLGFYMSNGMGMIPITFQELDSYCRRTNTDLNSEESILIIQMSRAYIQEINDTNPESKAPYSVTTL